MISAFGLNFSILVYSLEAYQDLCQSKARLFKELLSIVMPMTFVPIGFATYLPKTD